MFFWGFFNRYKGFLDTISTQSKYVYVYLYEYDCFMYVHMCSSCVCMYMMTMYSAVRVSLVSNCAI